MMCPVAGTKHRLRLDHKLCLHMAFDAIESDERQTLTKPHKHKSRPVGGLERGLVEPSGKSILISYTLQYQILTHCLHIFV